MLRRLLGPFNEFGVLAGCLYMTHRLLHALSTRLGLFVYELMAQPVSVQPLLPPRRVRGVMFSEIGAGHPDIARMPAREEIKLQRFAQGARCLGAYRKGSLIAYAWFCDERYEEDEVRCTYELARPESSVFDFDLYVMPEHRMGTAFVVLWCGINEYLSRRGVTTTFSRMTRFNSASRRSHTRLGAVCIGKAIFLQAWACEFMLATVPPYIAVTLNESQRVCLRLRPPAAAGNASAPVPNSPSPSEDV